MPDDPNNRGPKDRARINVHERYEVDYWTKALGCTEQELRDAVEAVGVMADKVREYLRNKKKK
jgi:hypothetical protein